MNDFGFKEHPSYNALDRNAMFMGVPLIPSVLLLVAGILIFLIGGRFFGVAGFMFGFIVFPVFLFLRQISQTDDRALYILYLEIIFRFKRVAFSEFGNTLTMPPDRYLRHEEIILQNFRAIDSRTK